MLEAIQGLPQGIEGLRAVGKLTTDDYLGVFQPILESARRDHRRLRFLYEMGPEFEGFTPGAMWEDAKLGLRSMLLFDGIALVSDLRFMKEMARVTAFLFPCPVRFFGSSERNAAIDWLKSLPAAAALSHRILPHASVLVIEATEPLRAQDFDALSATADNWLQTHGELQGVVVHAREFPGWENLGGLLRHIRFVRDYHRKVRRIALAVDSKLASLAPRVTEHFVKAEIATFGYDDLERAIDWAGGPNRQSGELPTNGASPAETGHHA